jgi:outer membrane beta-barrel protein
MKTLLYFTFSLFISVGVMAAEEAPKNLQGKLDDLLIPDDKVAPVVSEDKLYIVNTRYSSLVNRHEFSLLGAHNFTADSHLDVKQAALAYRYHLNSKWSFGLRYNRYTNELTSAGQSLFDKERLVPDTDYALNSQELFATYNTIYGKIRWSADTVVYFDQFISLGGGQIELASGKTNHGFLDLGVAFWVGNHMSMRVGIKNEFYQQQQVTEERFMHNAMGYLEIGYLFGQGDRG